MNVPTKNFSRWLHHHQHWNQPAPQRPLQRSAWAPWHDLDQVIVGTCVPQNYFELVQDDRVREPLTEMLMETREDLDVLAQTLSDLGCTVIRPAEQSDLRMDPDQKQSMWHNVAMEPRDMAMQLGPHTCYRSVRDHQVFGTVIDCNDHDAMDSAWFELLGMGIDIVPPSWTLVGQDLFLDLQNFYYRPHHQPELMRWCERWLPGVRLHAIDIGGHADSTFHCVKPGVLVSIQDGCDYDQSFPGWSVIRVPSQQGRPKLADWIRTKDHMEGRYWLPGSSNNPEMVAFINRWLDDWLGYAGETVFEVNMLMVNQQTAIMSAYNREIQQQFRSLGIEIIVVPLRHRWFWDGGISCFTLPINRVGECESYIKY